GGRRQSENRIACGEHERSASRRWQRCRARQVSRRHEAVHRRRCFYLLTPSRQLRCCASIILWSKHLKELRLATITVRKGLNMFPFVCKAYTVDQYGDLTTYLKTLDYSHLFVPKFIVVHNTAPPTLGDYANWQHPTPKRGPV